MPQRLWLAELASGKLTELHVDPLPGIHDDPLAALRKAAGKDALKGNRPLQITGDSSALKWSSDSRNAAVMLRAIDNKDRWIASVDLAKATLQPRHRLHDDAWINWGLQRIWLDAGQPHAVVSVRKSSFSHLYTLDGGKRVQRTDGPWEALASGGLHRRYAFLFPVQSQCRLPTRCAQRLRKPAACKR